MKMKRIANNVALQTIGYVISGFTNVYTPQAEILP